MYCQRNNNNYYNIVNIALLLLLVFTTKTYSQPTSPLAGLNNVIGNVLGLLTGHAAGKGKVYPFPLECEHELKHQCISVLRVCHRGEKCNLECMSKNPPNISKACRRSHPCALSAEKLCERVQDSDGLFDCLKKHKAKLSKECLASEPCLDPESKKCKLIQSNEWGGGEKTLHGPNGIRPENEACKCRANTCKRHLHHPFCRPCGPNCVNNPLCGYSKFWCVVEDPEECNEAYAHHLGDCSGPFPRFKFCEESIEVFLDTPNLPKKEKTRCNAQLRLHEKDPKICPPPSHEYIPPGAKNLKIRPCKAEFSLVSFMNDIFHKATEKPMMPWMGRHHRPNHPSYYDDGEEEESEERERFASRPDFEPPPPPPLPPMMRMMGRYPPIARPFKEGHQNAFDNVWHAKRYTMGNNIQPPIQINSNAGKNNDVKKQLKELKSLRTNFEREMARERKEIDRERKEIKLEKQVVSPTSSWNIMNNMHLKSSHGMKPKKSAATNSFSTQNIIITCTSILAFAMVEYFDYVAVL